MSPELPARPNLEWLRKAAKDRLDDLRHTSPDAQLADAQLALAREYGFSSWRALKAHVDGLAAIPSPIPDRDPRTVEMFFHAVGTGRLAAVQWMLAVDAGLVNVVGPHPFWGGRPQPLHVAIETRHLDVVGLLLEHGADVNGSNEEYDHWTPLMLAINRKLDDVRDVLIQRGARIGLLEALMLGDDARTAELVRGGLPDIQPNGGSILAFARTPFAIDWLIELGAPVDVPDRWGSKPIDAMSRLGPRGAGLVNHLIARGVTAAPKEYARLNDRATLESLVAADPSVARQDTVFMAAVDFGHHDLAAWLLDQGASVNSRSDAQSRHTALHSAAWNGDLEMVRLLLSRGADRTLRDEQYGGTAAGWARTAVEVTNNPKCAEVTEVLEGTDGDG